MVVTYMPRAYYMFVMVKNTKRDAVWDLVLKQTVTQQQTVTADWIAHRLDVSRRTSADVLATMESNGLLSRRRDGNTVRFTAAGGYLAQNNLRSD